MAKRFPIKDPAPGQTELDDLYVTGRLEDGDGNVLPPANPAPLTGIAKHLGWAVRRIWDVVAR